MIRRIATTVAAALSALVLAVPTANAYVIDEYAGVGATAHEGAMAVLGDVYELQNPDYQFTTIIGNSSLGQLIQNFGTCPGEAFFPLDNPAPASSEAGLMRLVNDTNGCIDYARTTQAPTLPGLQAVRFGGDSVTWAALPQSVGGHAPANLSLQDLTLIFQCVITNWSQVPGGAPAPIIRYMTYTDVAIWQTILGFNPMHPPGNCPAPTLIAENKIHQIPGTDRNNAIVPYSKAAWTAQANSPLTGVADYRSGFVLGTIKMPGQATPLAAGAPGFPGNRDMYNVHKTGAPQPLTDFLAWAAEQDDIKAMFGLTP